MAFPTSGLVNNLVHKEGNRSFVYDSATGVWDRVREADTSNLDIQSGNIGPLVTGGAGLVSSPLSHRNLIINGGMQVWQRKTAATTAASTCETVDRWSTNVSNDGAYTSEKHTMTMPDLNTTGHATALKLVCTTADTSIAAGQYASLLQRIEATNCVHLQYGTAAAKTLTLSFWVKSNKTGIYTISLQKEDTQSYFYPREYTISAADTWEKKIITITPTAGSTSLITSAAGIINNDNGRGLTLGFGLAWGSTYNTGTNDTWTTAVKLGTTNQVNWLDSTSNNFYLTGVQLEIGSTETPFEHRSYGDELLRCMRYCQVYKSDAEDGSNNSMCTGWATSTSAARFIQPFPVWFRAAPSLSFPQALSTMWISDGATASRVCSSLSVNAYITARMMDINFGIGTAGATAFRAHYFFLQNPSTNKLIFSAEL